MKAEACALTGYSLQSLDNVSYSLTLTVIVGFLQNLFVRECMLVAFLLILRNKPYEKT